MRYEIIGVHVADIDGDLHVAQNPDHPHGSVRVRIFTDGDDYRDEDLAIPALPPGVPRTAEVIGAFVAPAIEQRMRAIGSVPHGKHKGPSAELR